MSMKEQGMQGDVMNDFMKLMWLRKTGDSNMVLHMFSHPREYRECVNYYTNLLDDLEILVNIRKKPDKTTFDLTNGIKLVLLLTSNIEKLHGYRYRTFRVYGVYNG